MNYTAYRIMHSINVFIHRSKSALPLMLLFSCLFLKCQLIGVTFFLKRFLKVASLNVLQLVSIIRSFYNDKIIDWGEVLSVTRTMTSISTLKFINRKKYNDSLFLQWSYQFYYDSCVRRSLITPQGIISSCELRFKF